MQYTWLRTVLTAVSLVGMLAGTSFADHQVIKGRPPALRIISPVNGATIANPVLVVFQTPADMSKMTMDSTMKGGKMDMMKAGPHLHVDVDKRVTMPTTKLITRVGMNRYQYSLGNVKVGKHAIRLYWADARHHRPLSAVHTVRVTVK